MSDRLQRAIADRAKSAEKVDLQPATAFEALLAEQLRQQSADLQKLQGRVDGLLWAVITAVVLGIVMQIGGW